MSLFSMAFRTLPSSVQWALFGVTLTAVGGSLLWIYFTPQGAALYSHNHTERPIFSYWVNGKGGGDAGAHGGGGITCCSSIVGDQLRVVWIKSRTGQQAREGLKEERHELLIPNPPRERQDDTLHVHFFPNDQIRVAWSSDHYSPYENNASSGKAARLNKDTP
ncbi:DUF3304 domain-containing protein [Pseudomonas sp. NPDC098747]|uniref:DUF3304 domain-containing protein n=1 Tax=Pseudomonas sp. NPDC098747 TaxID=3364487 RepID=UPI00383A8552